MNNRLAVHDFAPDAELLDASGTTINLNSLWEAGPTVLVFLRHFG